MADLKGEFRKYSLLLLLPIVAITIWILGEAMYFIGGSSALNLLGIIVSATLTAALVTLYFKQTDILNAQHELLTQELNREARQQHTETLRDRVRKWHGNPDKETPDHPLEDIERNIPSIIGASFHSASANGFYEGIQDDEFQVLPDSLNGDRYLTDLLENHAPDLQNTKDEIESLHENFIESRTQFRETFSDDLVLESESYRLEPADYLYQWLFEFLILYENGSIDTFEQIRDTAQSQFEQGSMNFRSNKGQFSRDVELPGDIKRPIFYGMGSSNDIDVFEGQEEAIEETIFEHLDQVLDLIEEESPYRQVENSAKIINDAQEAVVKLEELLIEYDGRPIYPGDCKYLEEARIDIEQA